MALAFVILIAPMANTATDIGWPEAVGRLAGARSKAVTCAGLLKGHGDKEQISSGQLAYGEAKANFDTVIGGLATALTEGAQPKSLPSLEAGLENGASALRTFCTTVRIKALAISEVRCNRHHDDGPSVFAGRPAFCQ